MDAVQAEQRRRTTLPELRSPPVTMTDSNQHDELTQEWIDGDLTFDDVEVEHETVDSDDVDVVWEADN